MTAIDTSVVVAAFATWHQFHESARTALTGKPGLPVQAALEAYSVLTRMPAPHRASAAIVSDFINSNFADSLLSLSTDRFLPLMSELANLGFAGGAAYDAVIAATARDANRTLLTLDLRARPTYERIGVAVEYLG